MTYTPDHDHYQQLRRAPYTAIKVPYTGPFDCTAWAGAEAVDADREGTLKITGAQVRKHSNEANPDNNSPGLNLNQIDESILELTKGKVDLDIHIGMDVSAAQRKIEDGRWGVIQVNRGVLVNAGYGGGNGFMGGHAETVHFVTGRPVLGDPLVDHYMRASWAPIWRATGLLVTGPSGSVLGLWRVNVGFTRDITPDWKATVPAGAHFSHFALDSTGKVVVPPPKHSRTPGGFSALCTPPYYVKYPGHGSIKVVKLTSGSRAGYVIRAKWADQVQP